MIQYALQVRHVLVERDILTATKTPWLVRLLYAFQDPQYVYLAMEYVPGGDFRTLLNNSGVLKEEHARFYISEMFAAVNELHKLGYIHRDLKPEVSESRYRLRPNSLYAHLELSGGWYRPRQADRFWFSDWGSQSQTNRIAQG
jgi:serine/threonine protein kinase